MSTDKKIICIALVIMFTIISGTIVFVFGEKYDERQKRVDMDIDNVRVENTDGDCIYEITTSGIDSDYAPHIQIDNNTARITVPKNTCECLECDGEGGNK